MTTTAGPGEHFHRGRTMNRAYSLLTVKSVDEDQRIIEGIASTPETDRMNDIVELDGMSYKLPLPFLRGHSSREPIGHVVKAQKTEDGLSIRAKIAPAGLLGYVDEAWAQIKAGLIGGLSIGFRPIEEAFNKETGGYRFTKTELFEISAVVIPANASATITLVKSIDAQLLAASGHHKQTSVKLNLNLPYVQGLTAKGKTVTIQEQITQFENKRAASAARMDAIMTKAGETGSTLDDAEQQEYDGLDTEIQSIDKHLVRLKAHQARLVATAKPVTPENTATVEKASDTRGGNIVRVQVNDLTPKGVGFVRALMAMGATKGNRYEAAEQAMARWPDMGDAIVGIIKAEQLPGTTTGTTWAAPLMQSSQRLVGEFIELARAEAIVGRLSLRNVPFNVSVPAQTGGGTYNWVGENKPKPVSGLSLATVVVRLNKIAGIIPYTKEALRLSDPSIETTVRNDMVRGTADFMDLQFIDPAVHLSIGVNPASITDQIVPTAASGLTAAALRADLRNIMGKFVTNKESLTTARFLLSGTVALNISSMVNALGQKEFPDLTATGGSILGVPAIVSQNVGARIILVQPDEILFASDPSGASIDISEEASVVMTTTPEQSPQATSLVSFWQNNLIGLRVDLWVSWTRSVTTAVEYLSSAVYSG